MNRFAHVPLAGSGIFDFFHQHRMMPPRQGQQQRSREIHTQKRTCGLLRHKLSIHRRMRIQAVKSQHSLDIAFRKAFFFGQLIV